MRKEANFGNTIAEILRKKQERGERNDVMDVEERKRIYGNDNAKKKMNCRNWRIKKKKKKTELWLE